MNSNLKILVVEDEVVAAMMLQSELKKRGLPNLRYVTTGEKALVSARAEAPDIILMDIRLAGQMDGIEAAKAIKEEIDTQFLFMSGYDDADIRSRAEFLKPLAFLSKPLGIDTLCEIIEKYAAYLELRP